MSKTTVLQLATDLSLGVADQDEISVYYDEIVRELGFREVLMETNTIDVEEGEPSYDFSDANILALEIHHNDTGRLSHMTGLGLRAAVGSNWRLRRGPPQAFTQDEKSSDEIRLYPIPNKDGLLTVIQTASFDDILEYLELPVALEICHREFMRESGHQDVEFAIMAHGLSKFFLNLIDIGVPESG